MLIVNQNVLDDIGRGFSVPAQPTLLLEIFKLMAEVEPDSNAISRAISKDIALSAAILKTINSPRYGLNRTITDIKMSVNYIGVTGVVMLVTSSLLKKSFDPKDSSINLEDFWLFTSDIANAATLIGQRFKPNIAHDKFFSLGLFHACGIPVMAMKYKNYQQLLDKALTSPELSLNSLENKHYGVNHATVGYYVASSWRIPRDVCQIILQQHDKNFIKHATGKVEQDLYAVLKLSEQLISLKYSDADSAGWGDISRNVTRVLSIDDKQLALLSDEFTNSA
jgi:HD-like signal output (HDOD) protein